MEKKASGMYEHCTTAVGSGAVWAAPWMTFCLFLSFQVQVGSTPQDQRIVGYISCTHLQAIAGTVLICFSQFVTFLCYRWHCAKVASIAHPVFSTKSSVHWGQWWKSEERKVDKYFTKSLHFFLGVIKYYKISTVKNPLRTLLSFALLTKHHYFSKCITVTISCIYEPICWLPVYKRKLCKQKSEVERSLNSLVLPANFIHKQLAS